MEELGKSSSAALCSRAFPSARFVHVVRDGRDMAYSPNQYQVRHYGDLLLTPDERRWSQPLRSIVVWSRLNLEAADYADRHLPDRYLLVRFEDLCASPVPHRSPHPRLLRPEWGRGPRRARSCRGPVNPSDAGAINPERRRKIVRGRSSGSATVRIWGWRIRDSRSGERRGCTSWRSSMRCGADCRRAWGSHRRALPSATSIGRWRQGRWTPVFFARAMMARLRLRRHGLNGG